MINSDKITFTISANDQITDASKYNDVVIAYRNGAPIRVRDVGQAVADQVDRTVAGYQNNKDGVILAILRDRLISSIAKGRDEMDWSALALGARDDAGLPEPK